MKKETREKIESLKVTDVYSLILFALYQMKDIPEYSSLSEVVYLLDKDSLFNLLEYYGGTTIRIPTIKEFKLVLNGLLLYQFVNLEGVDFNTAFKNIEVEYQTKDTKECYFKLVEILDKYDFRRR